MVRAGSDPLLGPSFWGLSWVSQMSTPTVRTQTSPTQVPQVAFNALYTLPSPDPCQVRVQPEVRQASHGAGEPRGRWRHQHHCPRSPSTEPLSPSDLGPARTLESPSLLLPEVTLLCPTGFYSVCARPGLKNTGNPLMYGVLSPQSSVLSDSLPLPPQSQPLSPWLSDTTVTCLGSPPTPRSGCSGGSPALFLFSQGPGEHSAHGPVSENSCFMQSAQSSSCFSWEESWNPGTPSGPGAEVPGSTQLQSCFRSTQCSWGWARASCSHCETTSLPLPLSLTSPCSPSGRGHGRRLLEGTQPARHVPHNHARKEG